MGLNAPAVPLCNQRIWVSLTFNVYEPYGFKADMLVKVKASNLCPCGIYNLITIMVKIENVPMKHFLYIDIDISVRSAVG